MKILIFAPHPDDEILGVGGTIAKRVRNGDKVYVCIVTRGMEPLFDKTQIEETRKECVKANAYLGTEEVIFLDFPSVMLEEIPRYKLNEKIINVIETIKPKEVYIPHIGDMQLDHRLVTEACMVALRPKYNYVVNRIYSYETLSETGWNVPTVNNEFIPNVFEDISDFIETKITAMEMYQSQLSEFPAARSLEAIRSLSKYRGATINTQNAEAFSLIREIK